MNANNVAKTVESKLQKIKSDAGLSSRYEKHLLFKEILNSFNLLSSMYRSNAISDDRVITECRLLKQQLNEVDSFFQTFAQKHEVIKDLKERVSVAGQINGIKTIDDLICRAETKLDQMEQEQFYPDEPRFFYHLDSLIGSVRNQFGELVQSAQNSSATSQTDIFKKHKTHWSGFWSGKGLSVGRKRKTKISLKTNLDSEYRRCLHHSDLVEDIPENVIVNVENIPINNDVLFSSEEVAIFNQYL